MRNLILFIIFGSISGIVLAQTITPLVQQRIKQDSWRVTSDQRQINILTQDEQNAASDLASYNKVLPSVENLDAQSAKPNNVQVNGS